MASKTKSSRVGTVLSNLGDTWNDFCRNIKNKETRQNTGDILSLVTKLQQLLSSQEKCCKTLLTNHRSEIPLLFDILQYFSKIDYTICTYLLESLHCLCTTAKRISFLVDSGLVCVLTDCLVSATNIFIDVKEPQQLEDMFYFFHALLFKLGSKDKRVVTLSRLSGAVSASVVVLKTYDSGSKVYFPVLQVMKLYSSSGANCNIMSKGSVVSSLIKLVPTCGQKKIQLLKLSLELLATLCKTKTAAKKAISLGIMSILLELYQEWHKTDHRNRHIPLRRAILNVIKSCVLFVFGRKSFLSCDGYRILYFIGLEGIERKEFDNLVRLLSLILRKCVKNKHISLKTQTSVYSFALPSSTDSLLSAVEKSNSEVEDIEEDLIESSEEEDEVEEEQYNEEEEEEVIEENMLSEETPTPDEIINEKPSVYLNDDSSTMLNQPHIGDDEDEISMCSSETNRFKEFLQELDLYKDEHELVLKDSPIRIPTAVLETSIESNDSNNILDVGDDHSTNLNTSSTILEKLKRFNVVSSCPELTDDVIDDVISGYDDDEIMLQNSSQTMWNVEDSRVDARPPSVERLTMSMNRMNDVYHNRITHSCSLSHCNVEHVFDFVKAPEPMLYGHVPPSHLEPLLNKKSHLQRQMLFTDLSRQIFPEHIANRIIYDLDALTKNTPPITPNVSTHRIHPSPSSSSTRMPVLRKSQSAPKISLRPSTGLLKDDIEKSKALSFESRFECGNLRKAIQIRHHEYDLILNSDANSSQHHQWFYFQVEDMEPEVEYRFNIINCEKPNSQFNYGMCPLMYSTIDAKRGNPCWERTGTNVCYYRNYFTRGVTSVKSYHTATFTITFPYKDDTCFLAYHYPYSLTMLKLDMARIEASLPSIIFTNQVMCRTLGGNDINLLTITNPSISGVRRDIYKRPYILLTARVHPGESNSSWIMKGIMDYLTSSETIARQLRSLFIFKIVPMLNPDGVVNGCHRCSLTGQDLNRQWKNPDPALHPSIYHVKSLIKTMIKCGKKPFLFVDFHGHSRKKNVFMYGCQEKTSENEAENSNKTRSNDEVVDNFSTWDFCSEESTVKLFPRIMSSVSPYFSFQACNYAIEKSKESTARVVGFREFGIERSYTLESSYCGMDQGEFGGCHMGTNHLEDVGRTFCTALFKFALCPNVDVSDLPS